MTGNTNYKQFLDAGFFLSLNFNIENHFMVSGFLYPFHASVIETDAFDSYSLDWTIPYSKVAVRFFL